MAFKIFNIGKANEEVSRLESEVERLTKELTAEKENAVLVASNAENVHRELTKAKESISTFEVSIKQKDSDLTTAKASIASLQAAIDDPKGEIEKRSTAKATELMAKMGVPPVPADKSEAGKSQGDIAAQFDAMPAGPDRSAFFKKHRKSLI